MIIPIDFIIIRSIAILRVEPQDVAILTTMITVSSTGRPTLLFYVQEDNDTFVSKSTVSSAIQVSKPKSALFI